MAKEEVSAVSNQWHCNEVTVHKELTSAAEIVINDGTVDIHYSIIIRRSSVVNFFFFFWGGGDYFIKLSLSNLYSNHMQDD
jgi:hypothetical protein